MNTTVPMPPRRWALRLGVPILIIGAAVAILVWSSWEALAPAVEVRAMPVVLRTVETTEVLESDAPDAVQAPGWIEPDPFGVYAGALVPGVVEEMLVLGGDRVTKGQAVARLVDDEAEIKVQSAQAALALAQGNLADARGVLAALGPRVKEAQADASVIEDEFTRKRQLVESGAVARGPVERLGHKLDAARATISTLEAEEAILQAKVESARATVLAATASRDDAALALERHTVRSPIDGIVTERLTSPGSAVGFGSGEHASHVVHLYDPRHLQVRADIPLADAARVGVGHPAEIVVDVLPDVVFSGTVTRFLHRADIQKNTVEAKVAVHDPSEHLKPDMLARVRILPASTASEEPVLRRVERVFVPEQALRNGDQVIVAESLKNGRGTAVARTLSLGDGRVDGWREVRSGLAAGDRVILDSDVTPGSRVQITEGK